MSSQQFSRSMLTAATDPPRDRMKEQQRFDDALQQIDEQVVTSDVSHFVTEDCGKLIRIESAQQRRRQQNHRLDDAHDHRHGDSLAKSDDRNSLQSKS